MATIITGLMICVFSSGLLTQPALRVWGIAGLCLGIFLIMKGRGKPGIGD